MAAHQAPLSLGFSRQELAISFSNAWKWQEKVKSLSRVRLLATPWTAAYQAAPSMGFSRQEYWSGVPLPSLGFCHTLTWISHGCTCVPHPEPLSHLPPHTIPQGPPSALALSTISYIEPGLAIYFTYGNTRVQCYSLKSFHPHLLPKSTKVCSLYLCLFCCLVYRVIVTIFLNSIYMS